MKIKMIRKIREGLLNIVVVVDLNLKNINQTDFDLFFFLDIFTPFIYSCLIICVGFFCLSFQLD